MIGQAQGLLMARLGIGPDEAFALLVRASQDRNIKLRELARSLVHDAGGPPGRDTPETAGWSEQLGAGPAERRQASADSAGREQAADERDRLADQRETDADDRERRLDSLEASIQRRQAHATDRERRAEERAALNGLLDRSAQAIARSRARLGREQAADQREAHQDDHEQDGIDREVQQSQIDLERQDPR